jgi:hypothetical protein
MTEQRDVKRPLLRRLAALWQGAHRSMRVENSSRADTAASASRPAPTRAKQGRTAELRGSRRSNEVSDSGAPPSTKETTV